jgi:hypothetical protein
LEKWQPKGAKASIESWSPLEAFAGNQSVSFRNHLDTLFIAFLGYAIEGGLVLYFRAGREVKAIREDFPPGKEEGKG